MHRLPTDFTKMDGRSEARHPREGKTNGDIRPTLMLTNGHRKLVESREQKAIICFCWRCQNRSLPLSLLFPVVVVFLSLPFVERVFHKMSD